jgi:PIN domain nuclease of toxin-antitoxin system
MASRFSMAAAGGNRSLWKNVKILNMKNLADRSRTRRETLQTHRATSLSDAEAWDLEFWQRQSPEDRLSALVAIHRDVELVNAARDRPASGG